ncbi:MAG TPA: hypothetical protein VMX57_07990 [Planctomycetota bacterium]|nr:hypothetical protein [Planctomycetota bacterium]
MKRLVTVILLVAWTLLASAVGVPAPSAAFGTGSVAAPDARAAYLRTQRTQVTLRLVRALLVERKLDEVKALLEAESKRIESTVTEGALNPDDAKLLYFLGIVEEMSGAAAKRDAIFTRVRRLTPADEFTHLLLGKTFDDLHREDIAEAEYRRVLWLEPTDSGYDVEALARLAQNAYTVRRHKQAAEFFARLLDAIRRHTGRTYSDEAVNHFEYLHAVSLGWAAMSEPRADNWSDALVHCERAWKLSPDDIDAVVLGEQIARSCLDKAKSVELARLWRARSDRVETGLRRRINAEPHEASGHNALAWFLAEVDRGHDEAIRAAERALELEPAQPAYIDTLAECWFKKGDAAAAVKTIRRVVDVNPWANDYYRQQLERFEATLRKTEPERPGAP